MTAPWRDRAACAGIDPDAFYVEPTPAAVKTVCARCPVRTDCLLDALAYETKRGRHGVWGGLSADERSRLHNRTPNVLRRADGLCACGCGMRPINRKSAYVHGHRKTHQSQEPAA